MRSFVHKIPLLFVLFAIVLPAQTNNRFTGKWELNVSKSKFSPDPAPKSEMVTNVDGKTTIEGIDGEGKPFKWSFMPSQGAAVPIEGLENSTVEEKISGNTLDHTWKIAGGNVHGHGVLSKDGKTLHYTQSGKDGQGRQVNDLFIFEKQ
ncbi:MAG: hypothetical protein M3Z09_11125 [Acidobacteriota bacterium]|nr:hypothetical protein [Acidobacteriota bacterium]